MQSQVTVVGAGPGGLTAAMYLGRFNRPTLVVDGGDSRARWIPTSHNIPGFTRGIGGPKLLSQLKVQAEQYGARVLPGTVSTISKHADGFNLTVGSRSILSTFIVLATGVRDQLPAVPGAEQALSRSLLRLCPICDGFEATGKSIAIIGRHQAGEREAKFLYHTYSKDVSYLALDGCDPDTTSRLEALGIPVLEIRPDELRLDGQAVTVKVKGRTRNFEVLYSALGRDPQHQLAKNLGAALDPAGALLVDRHQQTSVDGLYAAGDVVRGIDQVVVAAAEAAIAATDIHNRLMGA